MYATLVPVDQGSAAPSSGIAGANETRAQVGERLRWESAA